jgi:hypothetical protein
MPKLEIAGFDGEVPRLSPTMLAENQAQEANNVKLYSRELRYWRGPQLTYSPAMTAISSIHKMPSGNWLTWQTDVDVVPGVQADDNGDERIYYTGDGVPKKSNRAMATTLAPYPTAYYDMGVPPPATAVTVTIGSAKATHVLDLDSNVVANDSGSVSATLSISDTLPAATEDTFTYERIGTAITARIGSAVAPYMTGSASKSPTQAVVLTMPTLTATASSDKSHLHSETDIETRAYVFTYVSQFGTLTEESAPSPPSELIDVDQGQTVTITGFEPTPTGLHGIYARRIYRTVTGAETDTYEFVVEIPLATTSYVDALTVARLGEVLPTSGWLPPPPDLAGLVAHPSGALAGFAGNTLYFSEPYYPHAWPRSYALNFPYDVVGLGVFGNTVVVATERYPYVVSGPYPGAMSSERIPIVEPCVAKRSIASDALGVTYASPNGLVIIGSSNAGLGSENLYRRQEWQLENPEDLRAIIHDNKYFGTRIGSTTMVVSRTDIPALSFLDLGASCLYVDGETAKVFFVDAEDDDIYEMDADELRPYNYEWTSKRFALPQGVTFSAMMLDADYDDLSLDDAYNAAVADLQALNAATWATGNLFGALGSNELNEYVVNGSALYDIPELAASRAVQVSIYVDGDLAQSVTPVNSQPYRLKSWRGREIEFKIIGNISVRSLTIATTVPELR